MFGKVGRKIIVLFPEPWQLRAPINFWITWPGDHVTTHSLKWEEYTNSFQTPMENYCCSYCISSITFWSLCVCLFVSLPLLSRFLISLCQHIPQTHPPFSVFGTFPLDGKTERWEEKKKSAFVGICVTWPNRLHMLVIMVQDVADLIYTLFIFSQASFPTSLRNYLSLFSLWILFLVFIVLYFVLPPVSRQAN